MERRGQARDMLGIQNTMNYIPPPATTQESPPVKLPLAPLVATSADRRGNATRRGSSIFSPIHIQNPPPPPPPLRHQLNPPPEPDPSPTAAGGSSNSKAPSTQPQDAPPPPPPPAAAIAIVEASANCSNTSPIIIIIYRECLKNHAAGIGGHIVDGCREFMASGEEGTPEALRCAACDCHRNFHRKEIKGEPPPQQPPPYIYYPYNPPNPSGVHQQNHQKQSTPPRMVNFGGGTAAESSSEDLNMFQSGGHASVQPSPKKRFRTKFSQEQKGLMNEFAEKLEWRMQKQDDQQVQQFCSEVGVKRQVFKVWMHNNKQAMKKKQV